MRSAGVEWGMAMRAKPGETACGDRCLVQQAGDKLMAALIDALGHGPPAAATAQAAAEVLGRHAQEAPGALMRRCHECLHRTRGAAVSIALIDPGHETLTWLGVGNVSGVLRPAAGAAAARPRMLLVRAGCVGDRLPLLRPSRLRFAAGEMLILASDGLRADFAENPAIAGDDPQRVAERLLAACAQPGDDAAVLALRLQEDEP